MGTNRTDAVWTSHDSDRAFIDAESFMKGLDQLPDSLYVCFRHGSYLGQKI